MAESKINHSCQYKEYSKAVTSGTFYFRRYNNMVFVQCIAAVTSVAGTYQNWFTAPADFIPSKDQYVPCLIGGGANTMAMVRILTNGAISLYSATSISNQTIWLSGCYMLN